jgi:hypothetical protein
MHFHWLQTLPAHSCSAAAAAVAAVLAALIPVASLQPLHQSILVEGSEDEDLPDDAAAAAAAADEEPVGLEGLLNQVGAEMHHRTKCHPPFAAKLTVLLMLRL